MILDVAVSVADDWRIALAAISAQDGPPTVQYVGTVDGLAGLVADLYVAGVADGVTLIAATPDGDVRPHAHGVHRRLRIPAA